MLARLTFGRGIDWCLWIADNGALSPLASTDLLDTCLRGRLYQRRQKPEPYVALPADALKSWQCGVMPPLLRQAIKCVAWQRGILAGHLAERLGLSRSCISKVLAGTRGLSREKADALKYWLQSGRSGKE
jgi:hypothetical protein